VAWPLRLDVVAVAGGLALLISLWLPWFSRQVAALGAEDLQSGWDALGLGTGSLVAAVAGVGVTWGLRRAGSLSAIWVVAAGALALVVTTGAMTTQLGVDSGAAVAYVPAWGLLVAYGGGAMVLLAGVAALLAYARERSKST